MSILSNSADMQKAECKKTSWLSAEFYMRLDILQQAVLLRYVFSPLSAPEKGM